MLRGVLYSRGGQRDVEKTFQLFLPQSGGLLSTAHSQDGRSFHYLNKIISIFKHAGHPSKFGVFVFTFLPKKDRDRTLTVQASHLLSCLCIVRNSPFWHKNARKPNSFQILLRIPNF